MLDVELAYLAGLFDGEGHISFQSAGAGKRRRLVMQVKMTDKARVEDFLHAFGGSFGPAKVLHAHYLPMWKWTVSDKKARAAYEQLRPFLRLKQMPEVVSSPA